MSKLTSQELDSSKLAASTTKSGLVQLNNTVTSTSTTQAATANAVKTAYDLANHSHPYLPTGSNGTTTGSLTIQKASNGTIAGSSVGMGMLELVSTAATASGMTFHRPGQYAVNFGLDSDNKLKVGGYSMGAVSHEIYHSGNFAAVRDVSRNLSVADLNNANFPYPYRASTANGVDLGLPYTWWHIDYYRHQDNNGYAVQVAYSLDGNAPEAVYYRRSLGTVWQSWINLRDASSVGGYTAAQLLAASSGDNYRTMPLPTAGTITVPASAAAQTSFTTWFTINGSFNLKFLSLWSGPYIYNTEFQILIDGSIIAYYKLNGSANTYRITFADLKTVKEHHHASGPVVPILPASLGGSHRLNDMSFPSNGNFVQSYPGPTMISLPLHENGFLFPSSIKVNSSLSVLYKHGNNTQPSANSLGYAIGGELL